MFFYVFVIKSCKYERRPEAGLSTWALWQSLVVTESLVRGWKHFLWIAYKIFANTAFQIPHAAVRMTSKTCNVPSCTIPNTFPPSRFQLFIARNRKIRIAGCMITLIKTSLWSRRLEYLIAQHAVFFVKCRNLGVGVLLFFLISWSH